MLDPLSFSIDLPSSRPAQAPRPRRPLLIPSPDHPDDYILEIDNSTLEAFSQCQRKFENLAVLARRRTSDGAATSFGSLFHTAEELRLRDGLCASTLETQQRLCSSFPSFGPEEYRTGDRMFQVLAAYNKHYANDNWPERVFIHEGRKFIERPFKVPLCTIPINDQIGYDGQQLLSTPRADSFNHLFVRSLHIIWTGRIDLILNDSNGLWVVDHKTTSSGGRELEESFRLSRQTLGYVWAAQQIINRPVLGLQINIVLIRPPGKTARTTLPREEFTRLPYFYTQDRINEWYESTRYMVTDLATSLLRGYFPQTGPRSFKSPCVYCEFHSNCQLPRPQRAADLASTDYTDTSWNPIANE